MPSDYYEPHPSLRLARPLLLAGQIGCGAAAIGRDDLGTLTPGNWADLVHVDLDDPVFTDPGDDAQLLSNLVWAGGSRLVRDVWVAGEQLLADGEPTRPDWLAFIPRPGTSQHGAGSISGEIFYSTKKAGEYQGRLCERCR